MVRKFFLKNPLNARPGLFTVLLFASLSLAGCGPGFPIQTAEQAQFERKVNELERDNKRLKERLSSVERNAATKKELTRLEKRLNKTIKDELRGIDVGALKRGIEETKGALSGLETELKTLKAETNAALDSFRQDLARLQGGIEESDYRIDQLKDELTGELSSLGESLTSLEKRLGEIKKDSAGLRASVQEIQDALKALEEERPAMTESLDSVREKVASLQKGLEEVALRIESLDEKTTALDDTARTLQEKAGSMEEEIRSIDRRIATFATRAPEKEKAKEGPDPGVLYMEGFRLITKDHEYKKGIEALERFISLFPDHDLADNAQYWIGEGYYGMGDYERAILEFDKVIKDYPRGDKVAAAMLKQGFSFEKLDALTEARVLLERVIEKFPGTSEAKKAKNKLDELEHRSLP